MTSAGSFSDAVLRCIGNAPIGEYEASKHEAMDGAGKAEAAESGQKERLKNWKAYSGRCQ